MRYQTWGLWLCDTRLGARPHHTEKEGEGGVLALRYQTGGYLLDPKVTRGVPHHGGVAGDHEVDPQVIGRQIEEGSNHWLH